MQSAKPPGLPTSGDLPRDSHDLRSAPFLDRSRSALYPMGWPLLGDGNGDGCHRGSGADKVDLEDEFSSRLAVIDGRAFVGEGPW